MLGVSLPGMRLRIASREIAEVRLGRVIRIPKSKDSSPKIWSQREGCGDIAQADELELAGRRSNRCYSAIGYKPYFLRSAHRRFFISSDSRFLFSG